jgi:Flp pilus assembly CpaE family ATPase
MSDIEKALDYIEKLRVENVKLAVLLNRYEQKTKHEWQGLDEDEVEEILEGFPMGTYSEQAFAQAIEQALKEKNT